MYYFFYIVYQNNCLFFYQKLAHHEKHLINQMNEGVHMKTLFAALMIFSTTAAFAQNTSTYKIDTEKTKVSWVGKKVAGPHNGNVKAKWNTHCVW